MKRAVVVGIIELINTLRKHACTRSPVHNTRTRLRAHARAHVLILSGAELLWLGIAVFDALLRLGSRAALR